MNPNQTPTPKPATQGPQLIAMLKLLEANHEARLEMFNHQSRVLRARYNLLLDKGFTEPQAIHLCVQDWSNAT